MNVCECVVSAQLPYAGLGVLNMSVCVCVRFSSCPARLANVTGVEVAAVHAFSTPCSTTRPATRQPSLRSCRVHRRRWHATRRPLSLRAYHSATPDQWAAAALPPPPVVNVSFSAANRCVVIDSCTSVDGGGDGIVTPLEMSRGFFFGL